MANKLWDTIKGWVTGNKNENTSTGSAGTGTSGSAAETPKQNTVTTYDSGIKGTREYAERNRESYNQQYNLAKKAGVSEQDFFTQYGNGTRWLDTAVQNQSKIRQYDSGVKGTRQMATQNMPEYRTQYKLAKQAGLTDDEFMSGYMNGSRWIDEGRPQVKSYQTGERGTRQYALDHPDEYKAQYNLAKSAGYNDDEFLQAWMGGTRWSYEDVSVPGKTLAEDENYEQGWLAKIRAGIADSTVGEQMSQDRLKKLQDKYGSAVFADDFWGQAKANFGVGRIAEELNQATSDYLDNPTAENKKYREELMALLGDMQQRNAAALDDENVQAGWLSKTIAGYLPQLWYQTKASFVPAAAAAGTGAAIGAGGGTVALPVVGTVGGGVAGAVTGLGIGMSIGSGIYSFDAMRGAAFNNLVELGIDELDAKKAATDEAIISSIIESGDTAWDYATMVLSGGGKAAAGAVADQATKTAAKGLVSTLKTYLKDNVAGEYGEEFIQEIISMANQQRVARGDVDSGVTGLLSEAISLVGDIIGGNAKEELAQAHEAGVGGAIIGGVMGTGKAAGGYIYGQYTNHQISQMLGRVVEEKDTGRLSGYSDTSIQQMLNAAENKATRNEEAAKILQAEKKRREGLDGFYSRVSAEETNGIITEAKPTEESDKETRSRLDQITAADVTLDKVSTPGLAKIAREAQRLGSTNAREIAAQEMRNRINQQAQQAQQQQTSQEQQTPVQETTGQPTAPVDNQVMAEQEAPAAAPVQEENTAEVSPVAEETQPVAVEEQTPAQQSPISVTREQLKAMTDDELRQVLQAAVTNGDFSARALIAREMQDRASDAFLNRKKDTVETKTTEKYTPSAGDSQRADPNANRIYVPNNDWTPARQSEIDAEDAEAVANNLRDQIEEESDPEERKRLQERLREIESLGSKEFENNGQGDDGLLAEKYKATASSEKNTVDGTAVHTATDEVTGASVEYLVYGRTLSEDGSRYDSTVLLSETNGNIVSAQSVGRTVPAFVNFLKKLGIAKFNIFSTRFGVGVLDRSGEIKTSSRYTMNGYSYFNDTFWGGQEGGMAVYKDAKGTPLHETGHQVIALARDNNTAAASNSLTSALKIVSAEDMNAATALLENSYGYGDDINDALMGWMRRNPDATNEDIISRRQEIAARVIGEELLARIASGQDLANNNGEIVVALSQYTATLVNSQEFAALLYMASREARMSYSDYQLLLSLYQKNAEFVSANGVAPTLSETADIFQQMMVERNGQNGRFDTGRNRNARENEKTGRAGRENNRSDRGPSESGTRSAPEVSPDSVSGYVPNERRGSVPLDGGSGSEADIRNAGEGSEGIVSGFENSQEGQQTVEEPRRINGDVENESLEDVDAAYDATFGREVPLEERAMPSTPRDVTAEEREEAREQQRADAEAREQRAQDVANESRNKTRLEYGKAAEGIFMGAAEVAGMDFDFDRIVREDRGTANMSVEQAQRAKKAMDKFRDACTAVAEGRMTFGELAKFYVDMANDRYLASYYDQHTAALMQDVYQKYENALAEPNPYNVQSYSFAAERAAKVMAHRMSMAENNISTARQLQTEINRYAPPQKNRGRIGQIGKLARDFMIRMQANPANMFRGALGGFDKNGNTIGYQLANKVDKATGTHQKVIAGSQLRFAEIKQMEGFHEWSLGRDAANVKFDSGTVHLTQQQMAHLYMDIKTLLADEKRFGRNRLDSVQGFVYTDADGNQHTIDFQEERKSYSNTADGDAKAEVFSGRDTLKDMQRVLWSSMNDVSKAYLDAWYDVAEDLGKQNGDVEEQVYGLRPQEYKKGDYIPLRYVSDPTANFADSNDDTDTIFSYGFTHERTRAGGGYVRVDNISEAVDRYINQSANHIAYLALGDELSMLDRNTDFGKSLSSELEAAYGKQYSDWLKEYVKDLTDFNPKESTDPANSILRAGRQAVQTGALVGSLSVPLKQISSYWAASGKLRMSSLVKAYRLKAGPLRNTSEGNLLAYYRKVGGIDPTISEAMNSGGLMKKLHQESRVYQWMEKQIPRKDFQTIDNLYYACMVEAQEDNPRLDVDSQRFRDIVNEKFEDVVISTQPIFTKNARAEYSRTDNEFIKLFSMFRTQQTQNLNRIVQSIGEARAAKGTAGEFLARMEMQDTLKGQAASAVSLAILSVVADAALHKLKKYKDEDDEIAVDKVISRIGLNAAEAAAGTLWFGDSALKYAIDKVNQWNGKDSSEFYGVNMGIVSTIGNVAESISRFIETPTLSNARYTAGYIAQTFGVPLNNAYMMLNSAVMYANDLAGKAGADTYTGYDDVLKMLDKEVMATSRDSKKDKVHVMVNAYMRGNEQKADKISDSLLDADSEIRSEAKKRVLSGKMSREESENLLLKYANMDQESVDKKNDLWEFVKDNPKYDDVSESFVQKYNQFAEPASIPVNQFYEQMKHFNATKSIDEDGDGKADISRQDQIIEYINGLNLTKEQKDMLWQAFGYKTTTKAFKKRPWK